MDDKMPKWCEGISCGSYELCSKCTTLTYGCVYYDEDEEIKED